MSAQKVLVLNLGAMHRVSRVWGGEYGCQLEEEARLVGIGGYFLPNILTKSCNMA